MTLHFKDLHLGIVTVPHFYEDLRGKLSEEFKAHKGGNGGEEILRK
jgi:hypothetical protein